MSGPNDIDSRSLKTLPVRVTGIVFWGLVVVGVLVVLTMLGGEENKIQQHQQAVVDRYTLDLNHELAITPVIDADLLSRMSDRLMRGYSDIQAVSLDFGATQIRHGIVAEDAVLYSRPIVVRADADEGFEVVLMTLSLPSINAQVKQSRKSLLLGMGGLFLLFGLVLQRVLNQVLTRPFQQMINTARSFSGGDERVRFDEQRNDEFGYLGRFINQALDYSIEQKNALHAALERVQDSERALKAEKEKAVVTLQSIGDAVITTDRRGFVEFMNPVAEELLGWSQADIHDTPLSKVMRLVDEDSGLTLANPVDQCLQSGKKIVEESHKMLLRHDGQPVAIRDAAAPILDEHGELAGVVMVFHDVGQARTLARQLSYQASHDPLTGLFNRREYESRLGELLADAQDNNSQHAVCYIDLDQFKVVNDVCGHGAGDELLRQLGSLLQAQVRGADVLARLGGDEFGVLLTHCNIGQAVRVAENIRSAVRDFRFLFEDRSFEIGASIGVVAINRESRSSSDILSSADIACYAAKDAGRNRVHLYEPSDAELAERRGEMNWVSVIRDTLDQERFYLLYQPIVRLAGEGTKTPSHFELLLRMRDPAGNEVLPMAFLPAAERYNMLPEIDCWVVGKALELLSGVEQLPGDATLLINLGGSSLCDPQFVEFLEKKLIEAPQVRERVCFEITEASAISNLRAVSEAIRHLRKLGCRFALDDFGSGLSSFGYLKNLDIDYVKIDGGFVKDINSDEMDAAMVRAINEISHIMGMQTIAEFVETREIHERLRRIGVDYGQGHSIATPRPVEELFRGSGHQPSLMLINTGKD